MKRLLLFLSAGLIYSASAIGQITGTYTIPGDPYLSIGMAISAINTYGVGEGGVTFDVTAGYIETFSSPTAGMISTATSSSANPIVFRKSGSGSNPLITAGVGVGTYDFIICISGTSFVTFDGIDVQESPANISETSQAEWGYAILKASETRGSQNVTIQNCNISLNKTNTLTYGIYMNNVTQAAPATQLTIAASSGTNSSNKFYNNTITNVYCGIYINGYADTTSSYTLYDQNNDIGSLIGNSVTNFGGGFATVYAVYAAYQNGLTIANSTINGGTGSAEALYGIYGGAANNANISIYGNTVTLSSSGSTAGLYGIYNAGLGNGGTSNTLNFHDNSVVNCTYSTANAVIFYGIYNVATAGTINMYGNFAQNNVIGGTCSQYLIYTNSTAGNNVNVYNNTVSGNQCSGTGTQSNISYIMGIQTIGWGSMNIHDNQVFNNSIPNQTQYGGVIYGIHSGFSAGNVSIYNNSVHDLSVGSSATKSTTHNIFGFYCSLNSFSNATSNSIYNNNIYNLIMTLASAQGGYMYGIYSGYINNIYSNTIENIQFTNSSTGYGYGAGILYGGGGTGQIYKNTVSNVSMAGTSAYFNGIIVNSGDDVTIYNNYVFDLQAPSSTSQTALSGINISNPIKASLFYNTIFLNASSTSATNFGTNGVYASTTPVLEMRNNLIINVSSAPASTTYKTVSFRRSSTTFTSYSTASNNNDFYAGTPSSTNLIFYDGTNSIQTLTAFKSFAVQRDANSITEMPPFMNSATQPYDLHLKVIIPNQCESGGSVVSGTFNITSDFDGDPRCPNPGYPSQDGYPPTAPDMGADEFAGIPLDLTPPSILFTPLAKTSSTLPRTLTATITDASGVPVSGSELPVLYWKKFASGSWNSAAASCVSGNTYTFTFGGGAVLNDSIYYYIVAQDLISPNPNVGATPSNVSGYSYSPPACSIPPPNGSCYSYKVVGTLCGTLNIGTGQTYTTIASAINDLNNLEVTCPVVFLLTDATYPTEIFPFTITNPTGVSAINTITIRPAPGVTSTITGSATAIIKLNSAGYITIDGSNSGGTERSLTISNTIGSGTTATIWIGSNGAGLGSRNNVIKNCNISNGYSTSTSYGIFIGSSATIGSSGDDNDNISIRNNAISKAYRGIYAQASTVGLNDNLKITNNVIGSDVTSGYVSNYGIYLAGVNAPQVTGNVIYNMINSTSFLICGIELNSNVSDALIMNNLIHDLKSSYSSGPSVYGINIGTGFNVVNATLVNNVIYNLTSTRYAAASTQYNPFGVRIVSGSGHKLYHNTINMAGTQSAPGTSASLSAALVFPYPIVSGLDIRNNIFANSIIGLAGSSSYCVYAVAGSTFGTINNNDYYPSGDFGILGFLGTQQTTLAGWQGATGQDVYSKNVDPVFISTTNLIPTTLLMPNAGVFIPAVPTDYVGANRTNPPDIGAYEFSVNPLISTLAASDISYDIATLNGNADASGTIFNLYFDWGLTAAYGNTSAATPATVTGTSLNTMSAELTGLTGNTIYHFRARGITSDGLIVYGTDMTFTTLPGAGNKTLNLTLFLEGLYAGAGVMNQAYDDLGPHFGQGIADQVIIELHNDAFYPTIAYSSGLVYLTTTGNVSINTIPAGLSGSYYITVKHRSSIESTTALPVSFAGSTTTYDFSTAASQAYGDNMKLTDTKYVIWGGDVNLDGIVDTGDMNPIENASTNFIMGYVTEDVNGDGIVDTSDMNIVENNSTNIIQKITP